MQHTNLNNFRIKHYFERVKYSKQLLIKKATYNIQIKEDPYCKCGQIEDLNHIFVNVPLTFSQTWICTLKQENAEYHHRWFYADQAIFM